MRQGLVSLVVLSLLPALAGAAVTNPEGFEGYALTTNWQPTFPGEGWGNLDCEGSPVPRPVTGEHFEIRTGTNGNDTQVLYAESIPGKNLNIDWNANIPDSAGGVTTTSYEFQPTALVGSTEYRSNWWRLSSEADGHWGGFSTWSLYVGYGSAWGWGQPGTGLARVELTTLSYLEFPDGPPWGVYTRPMTPIDVTGFALTPGDGRWYVVEVEEDNVAQTSRARVGVKGGAWSPWSAALDHVGAGELGLDYATDSLVTGYTNGAAEYDNFSMTLSGVDPGNPGDANNDDVVSADDYGSVQLNFGDTGAVNIPGDANLDGVVSADDYGSVQLNFGTSYGAGGAPVPEPATMLLLGAGSLLLLKRKRKS